MQYLRQLVRKEHSPSVVGIISETHRKRKDSIRSLRPVHCISAIGARAVELTKDHDKCVSNCGEGSPYLKLRDMGGKIILSGVDFSRNTSLHAIEDIMDAVYLVNLYQFYFRFAQGRSDDRNQNWKCTDENH